MSERKIFKKLVGVEEAWESFYKHYKPGPLGVEDVSIEKAYGRILAEDVTSPIDVPGFDRALMDGFAVIAQDTFGAEEDTPIKLRYVGKVEAGDKPEVEVQSGTALEIATGAPMPKGSNAVVMVEYTQRDGDSIQVFRAVAPNENVMAAGTDIMVGELIQRRGDRLTSRELGVLAAIGLKFVRVYRRPRVAILSTGNEIVLPGEPLRYGKIYDVNSNAIIGALTEIECEPIFLGIVTDNLDDMRGKLKKAFDSADAVITSGSTSAGVGDLLYRVINDLGEPGLIVHGLSVKPGKPTIMAVVDGKPLFGLPGYPTSALMIYQSVVQPILAKMAGLATTRAGLKVRGRVAFRIFSAKGRREFLPVHLVADEAGGYMVYPTMGGSGAITSLAMADGFVDIPENMDFLDEGDEVAVELFSSELKPADLVIIGSHCSGIDVLLSQLHSSHPGLTAKVINVGSVGGLQAVKRGEADLAGIHLLDEGSGEYNVPFLAEYGLLESASLVRGYKREQGFIVARGNPKKIQGFKDLLRKDVTFMNRNLGSGTRILIDINLRKLADESKVPFQALASRVQGYHVEAKTHSAAASAVANDRADMSVGIRSVASMYGLDFLPIADESYDFLIPKKRLKKPSVQSFLETLRSEAFHDALQKSAPGLIPTDATGEALDLGKATIRRATVAGFGEPLLHKRDSHQC